MSGRKEYIEELEMETFDLIAKITWMLQYYRLWNDDGTFTFHDGDKWARFDPIDEEKYLSYTKEENECYD